MAVRSEQQMDSPTTDSMATLVSMMPSGGMRIAAMQWLLTDGLLEASVGREKLLKEVQANMPMGGRDTVPMGVKAPVRPKSNVAGAGNVNLDLNFEAQELDFGSIPEGPDEITSGALFSPEGREIFPALNQVEIDGMNIDEYYQQKYEPKKMRLHVAGNWYNVSLEDLRKQISEMGLPVFRYGGTDGYIQHVERGSYKPPHDQRSASDPLQHHGPSLSDPKVDTHKGQTVASFAGGAKSYGSRGYEGVLNTMMKKFNSELEGGTLSPERQDFASKFAHEIERIEADVEGAKRSPNLALDVPGRRGRKAHPGVQGKTFQASSPQFASHITNMIKKGIAEPFMSKGIGQFKNPNLLGSVEERDGNTYFTLSPEQQIKALEFLLVDPENGSFGIEMKLHKLLGDAGFSNKNTPFNLEEIINKGLRQTPELMNSLKHVSHKFSGIDPKSFIKKTEVKFVPFDSYNMEQFQSNGYDFNLGQHKQMDDPIPEKAEFLGYMTNGPDKYRVIRHAKGLAVELPIDIDKTGTPKGKTGAVLHSGGITIPGNQKLGHLKSSPAPNTKEYNRLIDLLKQGQLGEPGGPYNNEMELPSVKKGIIEGKNFLIKAMVPKDKIEEFSEEMSTWAVQALWSFAGDPAFQFGYVSPGEIKAHLSNFENEIEKEENPKFTARIKVGASQDEITIDAKSKEDAEQQIKQKYGDTVLILKMTKISGRDIHSKLHQKGQGMEPQKYGTEEERTNVISDLGQIIKNLHKGVLPQSTNPEGENYIPLEAMEAFGDNAFEARKRHIAQHIKSMGWKIHKAERGRLEKSGQDTPSSGEGSGTNFEDKGKSVSGADAGHTAFTGDSNRLGREELWNKFGVEDPNTKASRTKDDYDTGSANQGLQGQPAPQAPQAPQAQPTPQASNEFGDEGDEADQWLKKRHPQQPQQPQQPPQQNWNSDISFESWDRSAFDRFQSFDQWKETSVVYDPKVPVEDGCGFNVWGAAPTSDPLGISIKGDADTSKSDPTGKGKNVRRRKKK